MQLSLVLNVKWAKPSFTRCDTWPCAKTLECVCPLIKAVPPTSKSLFYVVSPPPSCSAQAVVPGFDGYLQKPIHLMMRRVGSTLPGTAVLPRSSPAARTSGPPCASPVSTLPRSVKRSRLAEVSTPCEEVRLGRSSLHHGRSGEDFQALRLPCSTPASRALASSAAVVDEPMVGCEEEASLKRSRTSRRRVGGIVVSKPSADILPLDLGKPAVRTRVPGAPSRAMMQASRKREEMMKETTCIRLGGISLLERSAVSDATRLEYSKKLKDFADFCAQGGLPV